MLAKPLNKNQQAQFIRNGYLVLPKLASKQDLLDIRSIVDRQLLERIKPYELEAEIQYPGAPASQSAKGGETIRRLLNAYGRDALFESWAKHPKIVGAVAQLLTIEQVFLNPNHHNCVMTKQPRYSSQTNWHRDTRYWSFNNKYLVNAWLALGEEKAENGGMLVLPGSHRWDVDSDALDKAQFLIEDHPSNQARLSLAEQIDLEAGDCLLFSAHCFHAAGENKTSDKKYSLVFTYHGGDTFSLPNTKSSRIEPIKIT